ncbi:MAG: hypothetical protein JNJ57_03010 [Saprospiraceae bacterium]|nr:hypothetical protein [Saprospiraceae bacterium]
MLLNKIQAAIAAYKTWLITVRHHPELYKWESVQHFQNHWNLDVANPADMFESCFFNTENRRLWQTENWEPKRMMSLLWKFDPMTVRLMFDDLFNETKSIDGRIGRFLFGCDTVLRDYKKSKATSVDNNHYHEDYRMISLYLAFRYPESYAPYDFEAFQKTMTVFGARDIPLQHDLPRYFKALNTWMTFLEKDPEISKALARQLQPSKHFTGKTMLLAEDFCRFTALNSGS